MSAELHPNFDMNYNQRQNNWKKGRNPSQIGE